MTKRRSPGEESRAPRTLPRVAVKDNPDHDTLEDLRRYWRTRRLLPCGCTEKCRCTFKENPTPARVAGYLRACEHLAEHGLHPAALKAECRALWRRGGADRELAEAIVRRWQP